jgi:hypothetical protein
MNIITSKAVQNIGLAIGGALIALVAVVSMPAPAHAQEWGDSGDIGGSWGGDSGTYTGGDWSSSGSWGDTGSCGSGCDSGTYTGGDWSSSGDWGDTGSCSYGCGTDSGYSSDYGYGDTGCGSGCGSTGGSSFGGSSGGGYSMPSFGSANYAYRETYFPQYYPQQPSKPSNTTVTTNTCTNNSCNYTDNSIVDNSIKISDSYNTVVTKQKQQYQDDCSNYNQGYDYNQPYNGYSQGYGQQGYNSGSYNYQGNCYTYAAPIAYNTTPYITLSQAPYTGLDLGPMGEVLYWTFLVLWCLGAAYLIVVKRVQNKLVAFLNGFLFGSSAKTVAHTAHATHAPAHTAAASAPLVEEGIDPFIQSQIKRA